MTVSENQPLSAARSLLTFSAGADRAVLTLTALADNLAENEQLTLALDGAAYFDGTGDAVHVPVQQSLTFAIIDATSSAVCKTSDTALLATVAAKAADPWNGARPDLVDTFTRVRDTMAGKDAYTVADLKARPDRQTSNWQGNGPNPLWQSIYTELDRLQACRTAPATTQDPPDADTPDTDTQDPGDDTPDDPLPPPPPPPPPPPDPEISVTAGSAITEGGSAVFTITADPAPKSPLAVTVAVAQTGDYGVSTGTKTVTIPTSGSKTYAVATTGDSDDEADGTVTVTLNSGQGYTVSTAQGTATVAVADDDNPPPPPPPDPDPEVSITSGPGVTEGGAAVFTVTADPAPASALTVAVTVAHSGDFGVTTGTRTVAVPATGSAQLSIATTGDNVDEPDGSVTATLIASSGYTVSTSNSAATVAVADDDDPPPPPPPPPPAGPSLSVRDVEVSESGRSVRFMVYLSETPDRTVTVRVTTRDGTARHGADYRGYATGSSRTLRFTAGSRLLYDYLYIPILDDRDREQDETFQVVLTDAVGAPISRGTATVTIKDND